MSTTHIATMVFCTYCGQAFTRDEHLERHILTRESDENLSRVDRWSSSLLEFRANARNGQANCSNLSRYQCEAL